VLVVIRFIKLSFAFLALISGILTSGCASISGQSGKPSERSFDFGPIASRYKDVNGDWRLKVLGPLYERAESTNGMEMTAYRPVYSTVKDPPNNRSLHDYMWPLATSRKIQDESQWRFIIFYGFNHTTNDPHHRYRFWLLPFYFQGRNESNETYRALFPIGGNIDDFLGRDKINFVLFPIYSRSSVNDVKTTSVIWPLISRTKNSDDTIYRARFFPFYGVSEHEGKFRKRFVLWPFYTDVEYKYPRSKGKGHILFPLYGYLNLTTEKTIWVIPPFFRFTRGDERNVINAPWPFYRRESGKDRYVHYIWPLWGTRIEGSRERNFVLWPIFWHDMDKRPGKKIDRRFMAPFYSHTVVTEDNKTTNPYVKPAVLERRHKVWPIYSYRRDGDASRFRFVELWPFADASAMDRNLSPFWSIYSRCAYKDNVDTEVLWGLYRNQKRADHGRYVSLFPLFDFRRDESVDEPVRSWNILKGLIGFERKGSLKTFKLLYIIKFRSGKDESP